MTNREGTGRRRACSWFDQVEPQPRFPWGWWLGTVLLALAAIVCAVTGLAAQGPVTVANPAPIAQTRWVTYAVPLVAGDQLEPMVCGAALAVPGRTLGVHSQLWHLRVALAAGAVARFEEWHPATADDATVLSVWSPPPDPELVPQLLLQQGGVFRALPAVDGVRMVDRSPVHQTWRLEAHRGGWHLVAWETRWLGQQAVDVVGYVTWSDPTSPLWYLDDVGIGVGWAAPAQLHGAKRQGLEQLTPGAWRLWRGRAPHGFGFPFRGTLRGTAEPLVAAATWPDGTWLAFGARPAVPAVSRAKLDGILGGAGSLTDARYGAQSAVGGDTGGQVCFGAVKGLGAAGGDPWALRELLWAADDGVLRAGHTLELDGWPTTRALRPRWQTWSLEPAKGASDRFGKPPGDPPWGWDRVNGRAASLDDQHRGDLPEVAAYALTGDWLLGEDLALRFNVDEASAKMVRGETDQPRSARVELGHAHWSLLVDSATQGRIRARAQRQLDLRLAAWPAGGPARWLFHVKDSRVLPDYEAGVPWQDGIWCTAAWAQAKAFARLGDHDLAARFEAAAGEVARVISDYGVLRDDSGHWLGLTGVRWFDSGAAPPEGYFRYPRAGAGTDAKPGNDLLVGGGGWIPWMGSAFVIADTPRAREVLQAVGPKPGASEEEISWWAVR